MLINARTHEWSNDVFVEDPCSNSVGWSKQIDFRTPSAGGSNELKFLAYGDMGKAPLDASTEHYIQVGFELVVGNRPRYDLSRLGFES